MKIRSASIVLALTLLPAAAQAGRHWPDAALAVPPVSYLKGSSLHPWRASFSVPVLPPKLEVNLVSDISRYTGDENGSRVVVVAYLVGVRYTIPHFGPFSRKFVSFVQLLAGGVDHTETAGNLPSKEHSVGVGFNYGVEWPHEGWIRPRVQFDVLNYGLRGERKWGVGFSVGVSLGESGHHY